MANSEVPTSNEPARFGAQVNVDLRLAQVLEIFSPIITNTPRLTTAFAEHQIDTGNNLPVRCKLRPNNAKKQAIMDNCICDLLE